MTKAPAATVSELEVYVAPGLSVELLGAADAGADAFSWRQVAGDPVSITGADAAAASLSAPDRVSRLVFAFKARRDGLWSAPAFKAVNVWAREGFALPVADAGPDGKTPLKASTQLDGSTSAVDPRRTITYLWEQTGGDGVTLSDSAAAKPTFTAPASANTLTFMLSVYDGVVWSAPDTVVVRVGM